MASGEIFRPGLQPSGYLAFRAALWTAHGASGFGVIGFVAELSPGVYWVCFVYLTATCRILSLKGTFGLCLDCAEAFTCVSRDDFDFFLGA